MNTNNASSFFQTTEAQENAFRQSQKSRNELGQPIRFSTKILSICADAWNENKIWCTESGSVARHIDIATQTQEVYRGHSAPVTALVQVGHYKIATASWDKTIRIWDTTSKSCTEILRGHSDFVKCLLVVGSLGKSGYLLSGSSDGHIRVWDIASWICVYTLKGHLRSIETLALSPSGILYSAGSESSIRRWALTDKGGKQLGEPLFVHETSIYKILFADESLWTCSADKSAKQFSILPVTESEEVERLREEATFTSTDYVRDLVVLPDHGWLVTAGRDEDIRIFEIASSKLVYRLQGHFSEVSGLLLIHGTQGPCLVSASLDATVRLWNLSESGLKTHIKEQETWQPQQQKNAIVISAEEEAELADLLDDDE